LKERVEEWWGSDIRTGVRTIAEWIKRRKVVILISFGWSVAIASVIIASYWLLYIEHPWMTLLGFIYTEALELIPRIHPLGYIIILGASLMAGAFLVDFGKVVLCWIASLLLSFLIAVFGAFLFVWFGLGVWQNPIISGIGSATMVKIFEYVSLNVFRMVFPLVPFACLLTSFVGVMIRSIIQPSAEA